MQSGGGSQQHAGAGAHGRSPASAAASPSSSSSAVSASQQQQQQFDAIQQQQRQALQHQLLRKPEGNDNILAFQPPGFQGVMGGSNFMTSPSSLQLAQQQRKYLEMVQQHGSPLIREEGQNKNLVHEQQALHPVHQAYMQYALQNAKQKSVLGMQPQGQANLGIGSPSSVKDQDMRMANLKMQELASMQSTNQVQAVASKKSSEFVRAEKQIEQGQQGASEQRSEAKPPIQTMGNSAPANIMRPVQHQQAQQGIQSMGNNQMAVAAQLQAWARERNIDLSQPANANLMTQLIPLMQSRMNAHQKPNEGNSQSSPAPMQRQQVTSPPIAGESSPRANSSSDVSGSSGPTRARQTAPPGPFGSASNAGISNSTNNLPAQFSTQGRENPNPLMQPVTAGNGMASAQASRPSMNLNQGSEHSLNVKNTATSQEALQMQYMRQLNQSSPRLPTATNDAVSGNHLPTPVQPQSQSSQHQSGFTKQQLHVLKAQILAFRRLKKGESTLPQELLRAITPPSLESQLQQSVVPAGSTTEEKFSTRNVEEGQKHVESSEKTPQAPPAVAKNVFKEEIPTGDEKTTDLPGNVAGATSVTREAPAVFSGKEDQQSTPVSVKAEQDVERNIQKIPIKNDSSMDRGKAIASPTSVGESTQAKKPPQTGSVSQPKDVGSSRKYHGPLFDFPCFTRKHDSLGSAVISNNSIPLAYDIKDVLSVEGMEILNNKRAENLKKIGELLAVNLERKRIRPDLVLRLQIEEKKLKLLDLQARLRDQVDQEQQEIMAMNDREYRKFVRICERQRLELSRQVQASQRAMREKQLKSIFQWRKKLLEAHWAIRDARTARNRGVAKYHERTLREFSKRKDDD
ncbi:unnamed protein product, partial [Amaranthus hypochondriacus]